MRVLLGLRSPTLAAVTVSLWIVTIIVCYTLCVDEKNCPHFLPTLSDTFVYPPENYLSRFTLSLGSSLLGLLQIAIFFADEQTPGNLGRFVVRSQYSPVVGRHGIASKFEWSTAFSNQVILATALVACELLSWVGAICDSSVPSCDGNSKLHDVIAVTFFVLYNLAMIGVIARSTPVPSILKQMFRITLVLIAFGSKIRYLNLEGTPTAVLEWSDVLVCVLFTYDYVVSHCTTVCFGWIEASSGIVSSGDVVLTFASVRKVGVVAAGVYLLTTLVSYVSALNQGRITPLQPVSLTNLFNLPFGNYMSRWGHIFASLIAAVLHVGLYYQNTSTGARRVRSPVQQGMLLIALFAIMSLAVFGAVNHSENPSVDTGALLGFLSLYSLYMLGSCFTSLTPRFLLVPIFVMSACSKLRMLDLEPVTHWDGPTIQAFKNTLEWIDYLAVPLFWVVVTAFNPHEVGVGVYGSGDDEDIETTALLPQK